ATDGLLSTNSSAPVGWSDDRCSFRPTLCFFFRVTSTTKVYPLSLHDALPISELGTFFSQAVVGAQLALLLLAAPAAAAGSVCLEDRKSTRLNSSHRTTSYAVFCLKKKTEQARRPSRPRPPRPDSTAATDRNLH